MADLNIQTTVVPTNKTPYSTSDGYYNVRYRIVSENQENFSSWSSKFRVPVISISSIVTSSYEPNYKIISDGDTITLTWELSPNIKLDTFDIYAKWNIRNSNWNNLTWTYVTTTQANSVAISVPDAIEVMKIYQITQTISTRTFISRTPHNILVGDIVYISGMLPEEYNGGFTVAAVNAESTSFTVNAPRVDNGFDSSSSLVRMYNPKYLKLWVQAPSQSKQASPSLVLFIAPYTGSPAIESSTGIFVNTILNVDGGTPSVA